MQQLADQKIKAVPNRASTGRMNGFSFEYNNVSFKASQLGKKYSWKNLEPFITIDLLTEMKSFHCLQCNQLRRNYHDSES
jgi:hypothetical protein